MLRRMFVVAASLLWFACGGRDPGSGPDPDAGPDPDVAEVALSTSSQLVPLGSTAVLAATATDADGAVVPGAITWTVADPDVVSIDGEVLTGLSVGTTTVTASVDGVTSPAAVVWVAALPAGAETFTDDQLVDGPVFTGPLEVGARYTVVLDHDPTVGAILLAAQTAPVSGRVVSSDAGTVTVEVAPLEELFVELDYALEAPLPVVAAWSFSLAGFDCETDGGVGGAEWPEPEWSDAWTPGLSVVAQGRLRVGSSTLEQALLRVTGTLRVDVQASVEFPLSLQGSLSCRKEASTLTFPFAGALAFLSAKIPLGLGFDAEGSFEATAIELGAMGYLQAEVTAGFEYTAADGFSPLTGFTASHGLRASWGSPLVEEGATIKASLFPYLFADLKVGPPLISVADLEIGTLKAGAKAEFELTAPVGQAIDPLTASKYRVAAHGALEVGEDLQRLFDLLGIDAQPVELDTPEDVAILKSPEGTATADKDTVVAGDPVKVDVALDPATVSNPDGYQVAAIHILREASDDTWQPVAELPATDGQTEFEWEWTPTADDEEGGARLAVFAETTELPGVLLEIEPDSVQRLLGDSLLLLGGDAEIWTQRPDGGELLRLTTNTAADTPVALSLDRQTVFFQSVASGSRELYRMNADGTGLAWMGSACTSGGSCASVSHVAPSRGAFLYEDLDVVPDVCHGYDAYEAVHVDALGPLDVGPFLYKVHLSASGTELLVSGACPDIVDTDDYSGWRGQSIWLQPVTGGAMTQLTQGWLGGIEHKDEVVAVAPTGDFAFTRRVYEWQPTGNEGGNQWDVFFLGTSLQAWRDGVTVTLATELNTSPISAPIWSHDGAWLAFKRAGELWRVRADGTGLHAFTTDCAARSCAPVLWTPHGRLVRRAYDTTVFAYVYEIVDPETGALTPLPVPAGYTLVDWR